MRMVIRITQCVFFLTILVAGSRSAIADVCEGNGYATLEVLQPRVSIGDSVPLVLRGTRFGKLAVIVDVGQGPTEVRNVGTLCLDLGPKMHILYDGIRGTYPRIRPDGTFSFTLDIPALSRLRGRTVYVQALILDEQAPNGYAISNVAAIGIDTVIYEDFSTTTYRDTSETTAAWNGDGSCIGTLGPVETIEEPTDWEPPVLPSMPLYVAGDPFYPNGLRYQAFFRLPARYGWKLVGLSWAPVGGTAVTASYAGITIRVARAPNSPSGCFDFNLLPPSVEFSGTYSVVASPGQTWVPWPTFNDDLPLGGSNRVLDVHLPQGGTAANPMARVGSPPYGIWGAADAQCVDPFWQVRPALRYDLARTRSIAMNHFYDTGIEQPTYGTPTLDASAPYGTSVAASYQGGRDTDGDGIVDEMSTWSSYASVADGYRFLRYQIAFEGHYTRNRVPIVQSIEIPVRRD